MPLSQVRRDRRYYSTKERVRRETIVMIVGLIERVAVNDAAVANVSLE